AWEKVETGPGDTEQAGAMIRSTDRRGVMRSLTLAGVALLLAACSLEYRASVPPVEDEVVVQAVAAAQAAHDHPVRLSEQDLTNILKSVRVQFTTHWLQRLLTGPLPPLPLFDDSTLARVVPAMSAAMGKAGMRERI